MAGKLPPQPSAADRIASQKQRDSLAKAKVSTQEGKVIGSANRSEGGMKKMAKGGSFRASANGIASKGKTKAKQVKMACGGSAKKGK